MRLELTTPCLRGRCSNRLSYRSERHYFTLFYRFYKRIRKIPACTAEILLLGGEPIVNNWPDDLIDISRHLFLGLTGVNQMTTILLTKLDITLPDSLVEISTF